jgi:hypothetical protein
MGPASILMEQIKENVKKLHWHELSLPKEFRISVKAQTLQVDRHILRNPYPQFDSGRSDTNSCTKGR